EREVTAEFVGGNKAVAEGDVRRQAVAIATIQGSQSHETRRLAIAHCSSRSSRCANSGRALEARRRSQSEDAIDSGAPGVAVGSRSSAIARPDIVFDRPGT